MRRIGPGSAGNAIHESFQSRCSDGAAGHPIDFVQVITREANYSAFNGYHFTPSDYSMLCCKRDLGGCGAVWRTKAAYVANLPDDLDR